MPRFCLIGFFFLAACESTRSYGPVLVCALELRQSTEQRELSATQRERYGWDTRMSIDLIFQDNDPERERESDHDEERLPRAWVRARCLSRELCARELDAKRRAFARLGLNGSER